MSPRLALGTTVSAACAVAGPAVLLRVAALLWQTLSPHTADMAQAVVGLMAVLADYNCTAASVRQGKIPQGEPSLQMWIARLESVDS